MYKYSRKTPPNIRITGFCCSMADAATSLCPKNAKKKSDALILGTEIQTITSGKINRTKKTDVTIPIRRNLLRHNMLIVFKTLALTIALSTLLTTSKLSLIHISEPTRQAEISYA